MPKFKFCEYIDVVDIGIHTVYLYESSFWLKKNILIDILFCVIVNVLVGYFINVN